MSSSRHMEQWNPKGSPQATAAFIEEVLNQLAELAATRGYRSLATTLMMAALDAARAAAGPPDPPH
ncbi:MAG: hypothetical protein V4597_11250 [Pseudomonadota bacterium]